MLRLPGRERQGPSVRPSRRSLSPCGRCAPQSGAVPANMSWNLAPTIIVPLAAYGLLYILRWRRVRAHDGARGAPGWRLASFLAGVALLVVALLSPVDSISDQLASMHMVGHLLIADLAPILLILGFTRILLRPVTRPVHRIERAAGPLAHPAVAVVAYVAAMWLWHVPALYDAAYSHPAVHALEHTCFFAAGFLYWWHLLSPIRSRLRLGGLGPVAYMGSTKLLVGLLGIVLTFAPHLLYDAYARGFHVWGLSAIADQNVAGAFMALEQSVVMGVALVVLLIRAIGESEREAAREDRLGLV